jgi:type IV pilus assembly protein PilN
MRIGINLASRPYEDAGHFYRQWLPALAGLGVLTLVLVGLALSRFNEIRGIDAEINKKREEIAKIVEERSQAEAFLARPENSGTRDQARFLNDLFHRKAFSWTQVLSDLERIMPAGVQVQSIKPQLDETTGELTVQMTVATSRRDNAIELIRKLEDSEHFHNPLITSEKEGSQGDTSVQVLITATYVPDRAAATRSGD